MGGLAGGTPPPDDFLAQLARWSAGERVARSASERHRTRSLLEQSAAAATWAGILVDLAETGAEVTLTFGTGTVGPGSKLSGRLVASALDFLVVEDRRSVPVIVRTAAVTTLTPGSGLGAPLSPGGQRRPPLDITLAGALDQLAGERAPVVVRSGSDSVAGTVVACGEDVVTVRVTAGRPVYVPLRALTWVEMR